MMENNCPRRPHCDPSSRYRTFDGSCNNLGNPKIGMANTPLRRILPNHYDDGEFWRAKLIHRMLLPPPAPGLTDLFVSKTFLVALMQTANPTRSILFVVMH
jgi:hypothetical protein